MEIKRAYRYRLYPTRIQEELLERRLELCRRLFNKTLWWRRSAWEKRGERVGRKEQTHALVQLKRDFPEYARMSPGVCEDVISRVHFAYQGFFRRVKQAKQGEPPGHPKPHPPGSYFSFRVTRDRESHLEHDREDDPWGFLNLHGFGLGRMGGDPLAVRMHRPLPAFPGVTVRRVDVKKASTGRWYVSFGWDAEVPDEDTNGSVSPRTIALHPGLVHYLSTDVPGLEYIDAPFHFARHAHKLAKAQRRMAKKHKGSHRYRREKLIVARHHDRIREARDAFQHELSRKIVDEYDRIYINSYDIHHMLSDNELDRLNLRVSDAAWGAFAFKLSYKAQEAGKIYAEAESPDTVQECSRCTTFVDKTLADRVHKCGHCGLVLPRGVNAARNVRRRIEEQ